jgi:ferredoxin
MKYLSGVSTLEYFSDKCTGCGRCVEVCPHAVFVKA